MKKIFVLHPYLLALFPILFLFAQNVRSMKPEALIVPGIVALVVTFLITLLLNLYFRNMAKSGVIASVMIVAFFSYGYLLDLSRKMGVEFAQYEILPNLILSCVLIAAVIAAAGLIRRSDSEHSRLTRYLNLIAGLMVALQIVHAGYLLAAVKDTGPTVAEMARGKNIPAYRPNIYYIIVDGYARQDILKEVFDYDNSAFLDHLRARGFNVADSSHSNYARTLQSLGSSLNGDLLSRLREFGTKVGERVSLATFVQQSMVLMALQVFDYNIVSFVSGYDLTTMKMADVLLTPRFTLTEFQSLIVSRTPLPFVFNHLVGPHEAHRRRVLYTLDKLANIDEVDPPYIVLAHIISPHPPFVFEKDGTPARDSLPFSFSDGSHYFEKGGNAEDYIRGYRNQVQFVTERLQTTIDNILLREADNPPVIIVQGDHGSGRYLNWKSEELTWHRERFSILNAYYLPRIDNPPLYPTITPVNTFRIIFNSYFGLDFKPCPDQSFFSTWNFPYLFSDITDRLNDPKPPATSHTEESTDQ